MRSIWYGLVAAALLSAGYFAGRGLHPVSLEPLVVKASSGPHAVLYYVDPMHPAYRSEHPGTAPDCGMDLVPVYAGAEPTRVTGGVRLSPGQEQAIRLQTEVVQAASAAHIVHTAGRVTPDESRTYRISAGVDGWVRRVFSDRTGTQVKRGQALAAFYSKDISAPQQAYLYALDSSEHLKLAPPTQAQSLDLATQQLSTASDNLQFVGMGQTQMEELSRTRREFFDINLTAPAGGQILERHVDVGQRFMKGELLYRIANLDRVWVVADIQQADEAIFGATAKARIRLEGRPPLEAQVASTPPQFDEQGRTGKLRLEVNNPLGVLIPGSIVSVDLEARVRPALTVHAGAVLDSGTKSRVFLALGGGEYELRDVETGWQEGDRVEIRSGLKQGDRVVTTGAFLLDSESRMKSSTTQVADAECGMKIERSAARRLEGKDTTYYFCSEGCERKFKARRMQ